MDLGEDLLLPAKKSVLSQRELKYKDFWGSNGIIADIKDYSPIGTKCLNGISQGSDKDERTGAAIFMHSVHVRGTVSCPATPHDPLFTFQHHGYLDLWLLLEKRSAHLWNEDYFVIPQTRITVYDSLIPYMRNLDYSSRYLVLSHKQVMMPVPETTPFYLPGTDEWVMEMQGNIVPFQIDVSLHGLQATYSTVYEVEEAIQTNRIKLIGAAAGNLTYGGNIHYNARLRYWDAFM